MLKTDIKSILCVLGPYMTLLQQAQLGCLNFRLNDTTLKEEGGSYESKIHDLPYRQRVLFFFHSKKKC